MSEDVQSNQAAPRTERRIETAARIEYVPYWRLCLSPLNVRKKQPTGIESLAETIYEQGLMQNLVVHEIKSRAKLPKLGVCAGQRREAALDLLFAQGRITKDYPVPVLIVSEGEAVAASLIENREREPMCIADECVAFRLLTEEGKSVAHIAALFKLPDVAVRRALKIGNLAPSSLNTTGIMRYISTARATLALLCSTTQNPLRPPRYRARRALIEGDGGPHAGRAGRVLTRRCAAIRFSAWATRRICGQFRQAGRWKSSAGRIAVLRA